MCRSTVVVFGLKHARMDGGNFSSYDGDFTAIIVNEGA